MPRDSKVTNVTFDAVKGEDVIDAELVDDEPAACPVSRGRLSQKRPPS